MKRYATLEEILKSSVKGGFYRVVTATIPTMNKRNNPFIGRVKKVTIYSSCQMGISYQNAMQNAYKRTNGEASAQAYEVQANTGKGTWIDGLVNFITENEKDARYLHVFLHKRTKKYVFYLLDGKLVKSGTDLFDEVASWDKNFNKQRTACPKQADYGISDYEITGVITPKVENVIEVVQSDRYYLNLTSL